MIIKSVKFFHNNIEIEDNELRLNSLEGKIYRGQNELIGPITLALSANIPIKIGKARIFSEPLLFQSDLICSSESSLEHSWEISPIIKDKKLLGEIPIKLIFEYEYL